MDRLIVIVLVVCGILFVLEKSGLEDEAKALIHVFQRVPRPQNDKIQGWKPNKDKN